MQIALALSILLCAVIVYFLPYFVARDRHTRHRNLIFIGNLVLGWTIVFWFVLLILAVLDKKEIQIDMSQIKFSSHADPTKARINGAATIIDTDVNEKSREFVEIIFDTLPKVANAYLEGNADVRRKISDWFFSLDVESLQELTGENLITECTFRKIGSFGRRVACNSCNEAFDVDKSRTMVADIEAKTEVKCPACGRLVIGIV